MARELACCGELPMDWASQLFRDVNDTVMVDLSARGLRGATTLAAAWIRGTSVAVATVGDTGVYVVDGEGEAEQLTEPDHVPAAPHMLLQWLDGSSPVEPHVRLLERPGGWILLATDGVSGVLDPRMLADLMRTNQPSESAEVLVSTARRHDSSDDATAVVVRLPSVS